MLKAVPYRYRVLVLLCSLTTLTYLDRICISIVGVRIKSDLGLTNEQFGWVLGAFALAYALFEIPSGALGDRIGPRAVFIRIVLWWSLFTALTGLATGLVSLLIMRFLFGIGESGTYPNSMIVISRWLPANETGRSLVWVLICYLWFRNFPSEMKHISEKEKQLIKANCRHSDQQHLIPWKFIFSNRTLWALMLMYFCFQWAQYFFVAWMPVYLQEGRHFSENEMKGITSVLFIIGIGGFFAGGFAADWMVRKKGLRFGRRFIGMTGLGMCGVLIFLTAILSSNNMAAFSLMAANAFFSFGVMSSYGVCTDIGRNNAGTVTGAMNFFGQMGAFFLAIIFGKIADAMHSFTYPLFVLAAVLLIGCLLWLAIDPTKQLTITRHKEFKEKSVL